ncbi:unnamed protein product [Leptidea sinapis]|uniref:Thiolase N-terminal domain-containing protein n=1 Tax=Leptidea sinapis TaxID=189913 RepID=A0A5E4R6A1_9NEOP|nr:unnamed protein product [Leptidea sinapis]
MRKVVSKIGLRIGQKTYGGALKDVHPSDLFATAARQALTSSNIDAAAVDTVNVGHVFALSCSGDGALSSRHGALKAGIPQEKPAMSVNVQCGSGLQALISSAQDILTGAAQISLCGGTENMSGMPFLVRGANLGIALGATLKFEDALTSGPDNTYCDYLMAQNAEKLAEQFSLKRGEVDEFALQSHRKWKTACDNGVFGAEMAAVTVKTRSKEVVVDRDEHPSPGSDVHELCKLPVIHKRGGVVTVGNSAMNESFAAQTVACIRELEVDADRVNVNGGALALGHPVAASGARIIAHLVHQLSAKRTPFCKYGGPLRELPASHAFAAAAKATFQSANVNPSLVDCTIVGNVHFLSQCDGGKTPRYCGIYSGVPIEKPALGVNKTCASGLQALISSGVEILSGSSNTCLTGGTEIMSSLPMLARNVRFGQERGVFDPELTSIDVTLKKRELTISKDDLPDASISVEKLSSISPILESGCILTAGNTAVPADGAAALLVASEEVVTKNNLNPLARITGWSCIGVNPQEPGLGSVAAVENLMNITKCRLADIDSFEVKFINTKICYRSNKYQKAVAVSSTGGGQGVAVMFEKV